MNNPEIDRLNKLLSEAYARGFECGYLDKDKSIYSPHWSDGDLYTAWLEGYAEGQKVREKKGEPR